MPPWRRVVQSGAAVLLLSGTGPATLAQSLESQVRAAGAATVRLSYRSRPGVCGNGEHISVRGRRGRGWASGSCLAGPVRVSLKVRDGAVRELEVYVGGRWPDAGSGTVDLGEVSATDAADYLLSLAEDRRARVGEEAITAATLAEGVTVWPRLLRIARDAALPVATRRSAVFWLGQAASAAATSGLDSLVRDTDTEMGVRESAIFALSQRPPDEGVPALIRVVRSRPHPILVKKALFWLGQADDPQALALFEEILTGR